MRWRDTCPLLKNLHCFLTACLRWDDLCTHIEIIDIKAIKFEVINKFDKNMKELIEHF